MKFDANTIPLIVAACGMIVFGVAAMAREQKLTIDSLSGFGLYCAGIVVGVSIAMRGFHETTSVDAIYLVIFGVGLTLVSISEALSRIVSMLKTSPKDSAK